MATIDALRVVASSVILEEAVWKYSYADLMELLEYMKEGFFIGLTCDSREK